MKLIFTLLAVFIFYAASATNYYFSSSEGDDSRTAAEAQNPATPWKSLSKLHAFSSSLTSGDVIHLKSGDTFYGMLPSAKSGITFTSYGTGTKPIITGFTTITGWTNAGGGIYYAALPEGAQQVNMVTINNAVKAMGRHPNADGPNGGYDVITASTATSVSGSILSRANYIGAEVVVRANHSVIDRHKITAQSGNTVSWNYHTVVNSFPGKGNGFFIQNSLSTLDQAGEWYYNPSNNSLYVFFGEANPSSFKVKASTINSFFKGQANAVAFEGLHFSGANIHAFDLDWGSSGVKINNCEIFYSGEKAINGAPNYFTVSNSLISDALSYGIDIRGSNNIIKGCVIKNIGVLKGMGGSHYGPYRGIGFHSIANGLIEGNVVENVGYIGIDFSGDHVTVKNNIVDRIGFNKDDGGGIYTYNGGNGAPARVGRKVIGNIVRNVTNAPDGIISRDLFTGNGIYLDDQSNGVEVTGNTIYNCVARGIYLHNVYNVSVENNTCYDNTVQFYSQADDAHAQTFTGNTVKGNIFYLVKGNHNVIEMFDWRAGSSKIPTFHTMDNNFFCRPMNEKTTKYILTIQANGRRDMNLAEWKVFSRQDAGSKGSPVMISNAASVLFKVNETAAPATYALPGAYIDAKNIIFKNTITLAPYTSAVLTKISALPLEFLEFKGTKINDRVDLQWTTANEVNTDHFEIQKSHNGTSFYSIGKLASTNSADTSAYTHSDPQPFTTNYYRLKQVDKDGAYAYSKIIKMVFADKISMQISPNPVSSQLRLLVNAPAGNAAEAITIHSIAGVAIKTIPFSAVNGVVNVDVSPLAPGIYIIRLLSEGEAIQMKFIKQ